MGSANRILCFPAMPIRDTRGRLQGWQKEKGCVFPCLLPVPLSVTPECLFTPELAGSSYSSSWIQFVVSLTFVKLASETPVPTSLSLCRSLGPSFQDHPPSFQILKILTSPSYFPPNLGCNCNIPDTSVFSFHFLSYVINNSLHEIPSSSNNWCDVSSTPIFAFRSPLVSSICLHMVKWVGRPSRLHTSCLG